MLGVLLLAQAVAGPVLPMPPRPRKGARCPVSSDPGDVVVCARDNDAYRLNPLPPRYDSPALPKAELGIGNNKLAAEAEHATLAGGAQSQRLMIRLKIPLGGNMRRFTP